MAIVDHLRNMLVGDQQDLVDLSTLEAGTFVEEQIPMVTPEPTAFPSKQIFEQFIWDVRRQGIKMRKSTWNRLINYYIDSNYQSRRDQIGLEAVGLHGKIDPDELYECLTGMRAVLPQQLLKRDEMVEKRILAALTSVQLDSFMVTEDLQSPVSRKVKEFLRSGPVSAILSKVINDEIKPEVPVTSQDIVKMVTHAKIYICSKLGYLKGCVVRDGWLICMSYVAGDINNDSKLYWSDVLTLSLHESAHFCVRHKHNDYGFRSPSSGLPDKQEHRKDSKIVAKRLELGRAAELLMFAGIQVDWSLSTKGAAADFMSRVQEGRLPYDSAQTCLNLGMVERATASVSFGGELIDQLPQAM